MYKLSFITIYLILAITVFGQSPHGADFKINCSECHSTADWKVNQDSINFDHDNTGFELLGQHQSVNCKSCHSSIKFTDSKSECYQCHTDIHENSVSNTCENCHDNRSWLVTNIIEIHQNSRFPLLGAHNSLDCKLCHESASNLNYRVLGIECINCHSSDYYATTSPNHSASQFSTDCYDCHSLTALVWDLTSIVHDFFPLTNGHAIGNCNACHSQNTYEGLSQNCYSCHQSDYESAANPNHTENSFSTDCTQCHTIIPGWSPAEFTDHDSFYPLLGAHNSIRNECSSCHQGEYTSTPNTCVGCHQNDYNNTIDPAHTSTGFSTDCESCHSQNSWSPASFDHDSQFFPIYSGSHRGEWDQCSDCHTTPNNYQVFSCTDCHEHNQSSMNSEHSGINGYIYQSTACYACHPSGSKEGGFNHSLTAFSLTGAHASVECTDCHQNGYSNMSLECYSCHSAAYNQAPEHLTENYPFDCTICHSTNVWTEQFFNHAVTNFPLLGAHQTVDCSSCHNTGYTELATECYSCHQEDYNTAENHLLQSYPTDCTMCHSENTWGETSFNHALTSFPLLGAHQVVQCSDCHETGYTAQSSDCFACHQQDYNTAQNHLEQAYPVDCTTCHTENNWQETTFDHAATNFPLLGAHQVVQCSDCHETSYTGLPTDCFDCHQQDYNTAQNHLEQTYPTDCTTCHTEINWQEITFDHAATNFPLLGGHQVVQCSDCHESGYSGISTNCYSCHRQDYNSAQDHLAQNYPTDCQLCHTESNWNQSTFNHANTDFPLTGAHINVECSDCHSSGFTGTKDNCYSCHKSDYQGANNPDHQSLGFSTSCEQCHTTNPGWSPADFTIHNNYFPLTGAHSQIANQCTECHDVNNYSNVPSTCYGCHANDYNRTNNPPHSSSGFGTDCESCHSVNGWTPATFDHDAQYFPIYSGKHRNEWNECSDCHVNQSNYSVYECITCHEHDQSETNDQHRGVSGYQYISTACLNCHPDGSEGALFKIQK